jgi:pimeloyl-ACP methyl ester carboxylesterase
MNSDLADDCRLIAMDIRGHGQSDKPRDAYTDSQLWADDVNAAIHALKVTRPILCGWSYGPLIILDYIRHFGEDQIGGMIFVGGVTGLGTEKVLSVLTPEFLSLVPGFFSDEMDESRRSLASLIRLCLLREPSAAEFDEMLEYNVSVPAYVRRGLFARTLDNADLLPRIRKPVLIVQGDHDAVVRPGAVEYHKADLPHAQIQIMPNAGHASFWDDAPAFNQHLRTFAAVCKGAVAA